MPTRLSILLAASLATVPALAQTTGVVGSNDYTVNALGSGGTSCVNLCFPGGNVVLTLSLAAPLGAIAIAFFNFCPCLPCQLPAPANACVPPIPLTACGLSNQSFDMDLSPPCGLPVSVTMFATAAGVYQASLVIPPLPGPPCSGLWQLSTQAIAFSSCGLGTFTVPGPYVISQAFTLNF
ncbi:MAG: hypothetical protein WAT39_11205 [Planctomycetota bacterium]